MAPSECLFLTAVATTEFAPVGAARSRQQQRQGTLQVGFDMPTSTGKLCALAVTDHVGGAQQDRIGIVMPSDLAASYFTTTVVPTDTRL